MKINKFLTVVFATLLIVASVFAADPTVPVEVAIKGRQSVTDYLNGQIDHVQIKYSGDSIVLPSWQAITLDRNTLQAQGYIHDGSFAEFSQAIYNMAFSGDVVATPSGNYDVRVSIEVFNASNETVLIGNGYLNIWRDNYGNLQVGKFEPYLMIPAKINIAVPGYVDAAKWVSQRGGSIDLDIYWDSTGHPRISIAPSLLENGNLLWTSGGHIIGYNLTTGATLSGQNIYAILGKSQSSDTEVLIAPAVIGPSYYSFNQYGDQVVGRFPLRDVLVPKGGVTMEFSINVPIWGSTKKLSPSRIYVKPLYTVGGSKLNDGEWYEVPSQNGVFLKVFLQAGEYSVRAEFDGLIDWEEVYGGKDGGGLG